MLDDVVLVLQNITHYVMIKMATNLCERPTVLAAMHGECVRNFGLSRNLLQKKENNKEMYYLKVRRNMLVAQQVCSNILYKVFKDLLESA